MAGKLTIISFLAMALLAANGEIRPIRDRVGFATSDRDLSDLIARVGSGICPPGKSPLLVICPHDDYLYAARQYLRALSGAVPRTFLILGVFHSGGKRVLKNKLLFDSFAGWETASGTIPVSRMREKLLKALDKDLYEIDDRCHLLEHSIEAQAIFIRKLYPDARILPVIVAPSSLDFLKEPPVRSPRPWRALPATSPSR